MKSPAYGELAKARDSPAELRRAWAVAGVTKTNWPPLTTGAEASLISRLAGSALAITLNDSPGPALLSAPAVEAQPAPAAPITSTPAPLPRSNRRHRGVFMIPPDRPRGAVRHAPRWDRRRARYAPC